MSPLNTTSGLTTADYTLRHFQSRASNGYLGIKVVSLPKWTLLLFSIFPAGNLVGFPKMTFPAIGQSRFMLSSLPKSKIAVKVSGPTKICVRAERVVCHVVDMTLDAPKISYWMYHNNTSFYGPWKSLIKTCIRGKRKTNLYRVFMRKLRELAVWQAVSFGQRFIPLEHPVQWRPHKSLVLSSFFSVS